jgi:hypothetical protein
MASKKQPSALAQRRAQARQDARDEAARNMVLAGGFDPTDPSAVDRLMAEPPIPGEQAYTIAEFCVLWHTSTTTFRRKRKLGLTPKVRDSFGGPRILQRDIDAWVKSLPEAPLEDDDDTPGGAGPQTLSSVTRRPRKVKAPTLPPGRSKKPSITDPPPPRVVKRLRSV